METQLGTVFRLLGQYDKAKEYLPKALVIATEIGDRNGEGSCYDNLGTVFHSLGQYDEAKEYFQEALLITTEIDKREGEGSCYANLGSVFESLGQYDKAKQYLQKALVIATEIDHRKGTQVTTETQELFVEFLEIMKLRKYTWRKLYPYPEILEIEDLSSKSFESTPFCIYFRIKSSTPLRVFICALKV